MKPHSYGKEYIGQMGNHIHTKISEYIKNTSQGNQRSAVGEHSTETERNSDFDRIEGTASIRNYCPPPLSGKQLK
jgi:hypothetical protein